MVLSLGPVIMSLAVLTRTALDMADQEERRQREYQDEEFKTQQLYFNLEDFYKEEFANRVLPRPELLIQPGQLYSQAYDSLSSDSFYAQTPLLVDDVVHINDPLPIHVDNTDTNSDEEVTDGNLTEQVGRDSVEEHLKNIPELPQGLKDKVESDLIRRILPNTANIGKRV